MVEAKFGGEYLSIETTKDGDLVEIVGEGEWGKMTYQGKTKDVLNLPVMNNGKAITFTPGTKQGRSMIEAWGRETKEWVGKKFQIFHIEDKMLIKPLK